MAWALEQGDRVTYRRLGTDETRAGTVRKAIRILNAQLDKVPVYLVDTEEGAPVILGDGEIVAKLPQADVTGRSKPTTQSDRERTALLLDTDLFFVVKVTDTLRHAGYTTTTARNVEAFAHAIGERPPTIALVNTAARGVDFRHAIRLARGLGVPVVAFGSHVDRQTQEEARQAGATRVIANSRLAADLPGVLERALRHRAEEGTDAPEESDVSDEIGGTDPE